MGLETSTYVDGLNVSNPAATDGLAQADDHIRLIKTVLKNTFPNITGAVTATQATLNDIPTALTDLGITDGTSGQILQTDGAGNFSFISPSEGTVYTGGTGISVSGSVITCTVDTPSEVGLGYLSGGGRNLNGDFTATGNITAYSDERLKDNIRTVDNALQMVSDMRGVFYDKDGEASVGVIAQEMQKVLPEVVVANNDYLSVAYGNIVGVLIEAIKELKTKVEELQNGSTN